MKGPRKWLALAATALLVAVPSAASAQEVPAVDAGHVHSCALTASGSAVCWGNNAYGQSSAPAGMFTQVSAGYWSSCGVRTDGSGACWGWNGYGQTSPPAGSFTSISIGYAHACGLRPDDSVVCWGGYGYGTSPPVGSFKAVGAGNDYSCGIRTTGALACWGYGGHGETAYPSGAFTALGVGVNHACAVRTDGTVACWGYNPYGATNAPAGTFTSVTAGNIHSCGVRTDGTVACWGYAGYGATTPPAGTFKSVSAGSYHTCGVKTDDSVVCWGYSGDGQATPPAGAFNQPPDVGPIAGATTVREGDSGTYTIGATDPDGDALSHQWTVVSGNAQIDGPSTGATVDLRFTDGPSAVQLAVEVSDGHGHAITRSLAVDEANVAPTLSALALTGAEATACAGGNDVNLAVDFTDPAGANDQYAGTIDWGDGSPSTSFTGSPVSQGHHYAAGRFTATVGVSDEDGGNAEPATGSVALLYQMSGILQPINADGSSIYARKKGSTIPVKVRITDCAQAPVGGLAPKIGTSQNNNLVEADPVNEVASTSAADTTGQMRYDAAAGQYIYNLSTTDLSVGSWTIYVRQPASNPSQTKQSVSLK